MKAKSAGVAEDLYHWARPLKSDPFEPAYIELRDGKPYQVWFCGSDVPFDADQCEIAEQIIRK